MTLPVVHPIAEIWPLMNDAELDALATDLIEHGQRVPIIFVDGLLLDGRNRWLACERAEIEPLVEYIESDDPEALAWSLNEHRRHAPDGARALAAAKRANMRRGDNQHSANALTSQADAAKQFGVSVDAVKRAKAVLDAGEPLITDAVQSGDLAVSLAERALRHKEATGEEWNSVADIKQTMRRIWREDHPLPPASPKTETKREAASHVAVDTFGIVVAVTDHAEKHPAQVAAKEIGKWTRLNILDHLQDAICYLDELHVALRQEEGETE